MKLMDIDADTLQIPDTDYNARVTMSSAEFSRIVRDLSLLEHADRDWKEGVRFASDGEAANGNVLLKETEADWVRYKDWGVREVSQREAEDEEEVRYSAMTSHYSFVLPSPSHGGAQ